ncbi:uncharacterized protein CC84DRAFT_1168327 [Paraphaeosphaeria sporulosa]|uniref:CCHC-type domain-containing protein n=1 Tax=Paraphaeosphaeria sporulosa TaxID=1460663 RepID=A0A177C184_9PLEO|nr:uncharacterized protein CC84DRAFT_1168327 [Paraphaeosphaeria sporulosa]OAG01186.1 hypothetical protein CC84DRAFT_1168327 [Paraphaeosphaeria sporulosa]
MSSLSRRACFKCGNVGHYAGELPFLRGCLEGQCRSVVARRLVPRLLCRANTRCAIQLGEHSTNVESQRCAHRLRGYATTVSRLRATRLNGR